MKRTLLIIGMLTSFLHTDVSAQQTPQNFRLDTVQRRIQLRKELPGKGMAIVEMAYQEDWPGAAEQEHILDLATGHLQHLNDSLQHRLSQKKIYIELSEDESYAKLAYEEYMPQTREMVYTGKEYYPLKTQQDSVFVLKAYGRYKKPLQLSDNSDTLVRLLRYTFVLNDVGQIAQTPIQDSLRHTAAYFDRYLKDPKQQRRLTARARSWTLMNEVGFGLTNFNDRLGMTLDLGWGVLFNKYSRNSFFVMAKLGEILNFRYQPSLYNAYLSYNLEIGTADMSSDRGLSSKYAIGMGYFQGNLGWRTGKGNSQPLPDMFRLYLNMPVAAKISIGMDLYTNFILKEDHPKRAGMIAFYLKYNL